MREINIIMSHMPHLSLHSPLLSHLTPTETPLQFLFYFLFHGTFPPKGPPPISEQPLQELQGGVTRRKPPYSLRYPRPAWALGEYFRGKCNPMYLSPGETSWGTTCGKILTFCPASTATSRGGLAKHRKTSDPRVLEHRRPRHHTVPSTQPHANNRTCVRKATYSVWHRYLPTAVPEKKNTHTHRRCVHRVLASSSYPPRLLYRRLFEPCHKQHERTCRRLLKFYTAALIVSAAVFAT